MEQLTGQGFAEIGQIRNLWKSGQLSVAANMIRKATAEDIDAIERIYL